MRRNRSKTSKKKKIIKYKKTLGAFLVASGVFMVLITPFSKLFSTMIVSSNTVLIASEEISNKVIPDKIKIKELNIDLAVKEASLINGYFETFEKEASYAKGSGSIGAGNMVIFAHSRPKIFASLNNAKVGLTIEIESESKSYYYKVKEIKTVIPNDISVLNPSLNHIVTLYTCSGWADTKRLIVVGVPVAI